MSLFGNDDDGAPGAAVTPTRPKSSLFDDSASATNKASSSMFDDGPAGDPSSEWDFTPSKKSGDRGSAAKSLLAGVDVPEVYVDTFDSLQNDGSVGVNEARAFMTERCAVNHGDAQKIEEVLGGRRPRSEALGRGEWFVFMALVGLAQEDGELSLDGVDERRHRLPTPTVQQLHQDSKAPATPLSPPQSKGGAPASDAPSKSSFAAGLGDVDPWASPAVPKGRDNLNGMGAAQRTTSSFTTGSTSHAPASTGFGAPSAGPVDASAWGAPSGAFENDHSDGFGNASSSTGDYGVGGEGSGAETPRQSTAARTSRKNDEEILTVSLLDEKEGMFLFQHRNYEVASVRRNSKVIRRYSDFVWLLDCLHKRYPFRQLPLLPPKRVQFNGNHLAADGGFLEKRRRGLGRFANALVRHPVLREEQLVVMFLTVPTELAVWRKQATISVQDEFAGKTLPPGLEADLPRDLPETFDTVREGVKLSTDLYVYLCNLSDKIIKRKEAIAGDYLRFSESLTDLTKHSSLTYAIDTSEVRSLDEGLKKAAQHVNSSHKLMLSEADAWNQGLLEDLKTVRDALVSVRELFDRRDRYAKDNIPQLEKRIMSNVQKLAAVKAKGEAAKPGEAEKVENAIATDKQSIVEQHARGVFIRECIRDELQYFHHSQYRVSRLHQDWAFQLAKWSGKAADNWSWLVDAVGRMPLGD